MADVNLDKLFSGDMRSVSRMITILENKRPEADSYYKELFPYTGKARVLGVTGPPGSGKSTFVDKMTSSFRSMNKKVGIIAVDPTSPFTGGSILGDRMRMSKHFCDEGVFIRSMGTRGQLGGLSAATSAACDVLDAAGYDIVIVETVGVGQSEVEIASLADLVILMFVPGLGDDIQAIKAGVMEIGDIFVINKCDLAGADKTKAEIMQTLALNASGEKTPEVFMTNSNKGHGIDEVAQAAMSFFEDMSHVDMLEKRKLARIEREILSNISLIVEDRVKNYGYSGEIFEGVLRRELDPFTAAKRLVDEALKRG